MPWPASCCVGGKRITHDKHHHCWFHRPTSVGSPPAHNLVPRDVAALADELVAYHASFGALFHCAEQRT